MTNNTRSRSGSVRSVGTFGCTVLALIALSCGGSSQVAAATAAPGASAGDEPPPNATMTNPAPEPSKPARGRIVVQAKCRGKLIAAHGRMPIERELVVDFEMGQEFSAEAGTRHIEVTPGQHYSRRQTDPAARCVCRARKLAKVAAVFPWAKVQLNLVVNGSVQPATPIKLIRQGNVVAEVQVGQPRLPCVTGKLRRRCAAPRQESSRQRLRVLRRHGAGRDRSGAALDVREPTTALLEAQAVAHGETIARQPLDGYWYR